MTKLQFTPQMFECCIRETVHITAQKVYEEWLANHNKLVSRMADELKQMRCGYASCECSKCAVIKEYDRSK